MVSVKEKFHTPKDRPKNRRKNQMLKKMTACILALLLILTGSVAAFAEADLSEHLTISVWLFPDDYTYYSSYSDNPVVQYLNGKFNMTLDFQMPPMGSEQDSFNMMLGTGEYTDFFEITYSQDSTAVLFADGVIRDLAPYVDQYMPNFKAFLSDPANVDVYNALYDPDGHLFTIPASVRIPDEVIQWGGLVYRRDIVDTMTGGYVSFPSGNEEPTTVEDWEYMLELMKQYFEAAGMKDYAPLILPSTGMFTTSELENGFGAAGDFYVVDGEVKYGPTTKEFYNYLVKMHEWYEKGYIYKDFASRTTDLFYLPNTALTYGGAAGIWFGLSSQLGGLMSMPEYGLIMDVRGIASPLDTANGQDGSHSGTLSLITERANSNQGGWVASTQCAEEKIIRFLTMADYLFTEEGAMITEYGLDAAHGAGDNELYAQLGISDGTYSVAEDGTFKWNPLVDPAGETPLTLIALNGQRLPGLLNVTYANASNTEETLSANARWTLYGTGNNYPSSAFATAEESNVLTQNSTSYSDYMNVMVPKFITGTEELNEETFQAYVDRMNSLGVEESTKIRQDIYNRHTNR